MISVWISNLIEWDKHVLCIECADAIEKRAQKWYIGLKN